MTMAERIKRQRKANGMNQEELADRLGLSITTIRRWEWGARAPNTDIMPQLAAALGTSVAYLMGLEDDPTLEPPAPPVPQTAHESETVHTTGRLIYEWGKDNRLDLPDTPENRAMLAEVLKEAMAGKRENINA